MGMNRVPVVLPRREFLGGLCAAFGGLILPADAFGAQVPKMKFGVISDVHIGVEGGGHGEKMDGIVEKALRWFDAQGVDAVMVPGDIAHSGMIHQLKRFAAAWDKVFPNGRGADGRPVEKLFVTGNHDLEAWWVKGEAAWRTANVFNHGDNPQKIWRELFHEDYQLIWKKVVKGYSFIGSQWPCKNLKPPVEQWFRDHAKELDPAKPFFYTQHAHPRGTCGDGKISYDDGTATRALSAFPNAVAITGHSHQTIVDESSAWQGAFTSINAGCLRSGTNDRWGVYDSTYPIYSAKRKENRMRPLSGEEGRCGLLVDVFDDHLVVHRRSFAHDMALGEDWCLALPAAKGGAFDPQRQHAQDVAPEFASGAKLEVVRCAVAPNEIAGPALSGKPCVWVKIPHSETRKTGSRVYDFRVELLVDGKVKVKRLVLANGFNLPVALANRPSDCLFGAEEVPAQGAISFKVTPRTSFGAEGKPLVAHGVKEASAS